MPFASTCFLYIPIGVIALFSFNAGRHASQLQGLSTKWYGKALSNPFVMDALETSLIVAFTSALLRQCVWHHGGGRFAGHKRPGAHWSLTC